MLIAIVLLGSSARVAQQASTLKNELQQAAELGPILKQNLVDRDADSARDTVSQMRSHTSLARAAGEDPFWVAAQLIPWIGANFKAGSEIATSADDVVVLGAEPLSTVMESLDWEALTPTENGIDMSGLVAAKPRINSAAYAIGASADRLQKIEGQQLITPVAEAVTRAQSELRAVRSDLDKAADIASLAPDMLGNRQQRNYLLLIQNNAEIRATGGIPGAMGILSVSAGKIELRDVTSAAHFGTTDPPVTVDMLQRQIYTSRMGKYMQDVNLTPDFPTTSMLAQSMWKSKTGQEVDGVLSIDPIALSYVLDATGPVELSTGPTALSRSSGIRDLPKSLSGSNLVQTLLSDVYVNIPNPSDQDAYFAEVARGAFSAISSGAGDSRSFISSLTRGVSEGRILLWSADKGEQSTLAKYDLSGSVETNSEFPSRFGVYFNDATGAKMDYYVKRTVQLIKECPANGYEETRVRVTSTNTAPIDAATSLPEYVTGGGHFGVAAGTVQTNIISYGPVQANIESATIDGQKTPFAPYLHANRPVGVIAQQLGPGESKTVDFLFGKIVQHTEPSLVVTPTVQPVKDVILPTEEAPCQ
ncbi:hypothetical protein QFZ35_001716 [Arthrobacter ulcerisalmonis]|nr:DUF4012 domain-containing protein [Arthrobacter ulcerisalmonis]MDQ0663218.1 hypothetical protein [Arthrobacter ulcerisalmonis]